MKLLCNILWLIFGGLEWAIELLIAGILACLTIVGIPIGLQLFKLAGFVLSPFGKNVVSISKNGFNTFINILWACTLGLVLAILCIIKGILLCITIIGIPFGKQYFKMTKFVLFPFGYDFE